MALTQQRPPGRFAGRRYGSFAGKPFTAGGTHPVGILTQQRPPGLMAGRRYGTFAGRTAGSEFEIDAPLVLPLAGTVALAGGISLTLAVAPTTAVGLAGTVALAGGLSLTLAVAPSAAVGIAGAVAIAGDISIVGGSSPITLTPTNGVALAGTVSLAGSLAYETLVSVAGTAAVGLAGVVGIAGDVSYSTQPLNVGGGASDDRFDLADIVPTDELVRHQNRLETERRIRAIIAVLTAAEIL